MSTSPHTVSLQDKLIKASLMSSIIAGLIAFVLLAGLSVYQTMQVQDQIMGEISDMLLVSDLSANSGQQLDQLSDEFEVEYQLKLDDLLLTHSNEFDPQFEQVKRIYFLSEGYGYLLLNGTLMRSYAVERDQQYVQMYQPMSERFDDLLQSLLSYALVLISLWLILWGILKYAVRKQFQTIHQLSRQISSKSADDLGPIQQSEPHLQELQPMVLQLNRLLSRLELSLQAEQRFTADASHELRSPLSAINMRLQLLQRKYGEHVPNLVQDLQYIRTDVARGTQVLENLLLLARLDPSQATELPHTHFDLQSTLNAVVESISILALEKNIKLDVEAESVMINANKDLIFTCIRNVVDNAIRYAEQNGQIRIHLAQIIDQQRILKLTVENSGGVITEDVLQRLGERFFRQLGTKTTGSGLGLSICKKIIELHHGSIEFSQSDLGALKVSIQLPVNLHL